MSATASRRGVLAFLGAAPIAAAAGGASPARALALGRLLPGFAGERLTGVARALGPALEAAHPLEREVPAGLAQLATATSSATPAAMLEQLAVEARAIAALAPAFPAGIAAYRSFGPPMRARLYAELLARESERLAAPAEPPPTPPASPGPDA